MQKELDELLADATIQQLGRSAKYWALALYAQDMLEMLETAANRIELANNEGDPIMSAWLPGAKELIAKARGE